MATRIEIYPSGISFKAGKVKFRWRCLAPNGQVIATGHQSFVSRWNAKRAAKNARARMIRASIVDVEK